MDFRYVNKIGLVFALSTMLSACQTYIENAYNPAQYLADAQAINAVDSPPLQARADRLSFNEMAHWASLRAPELRVINAEYELYKEVAEHPTPLPNPSITGGPSLNYGVMDIQRVSPYVSLGFAIPLGPRLFRQNAFNQAQADQAYEATLIGHRRLYLDLRSAYVDVCLIGERIAVLERMIKVNRDRLDATTRRYDAGMTTINEVTAAQIGLSAQKLALSDALTRQHELLGALSRVSGVSIANLSRYTLDSVNVLPENLPSETLLDSMMLFNNLELAQLRTQWNVSDREYRLELSKQIPDLVVGSSYGMDYDKVSTIGLTVGMDIPVFDRNQQAIARTRKARDLINVQAAARIHSGINLITRVLRQYEAVLNKRNVLENELIPHARVAYENALQSVNNGTINPFIMLDLSAQYGQLLLDRIELVSEQLDLLLELENEVGFPLFKINDEQFDCFPALSSSEPENE